jgi:hypothetical protein
MRGAVLPAAERNAGPISRLRVLAGSVAAAVLGAAPHILHHVGPLAGAAIFAGAAGTALFGAIGLVAAVPLLLRVHRRTGSWRRPAALLALFAALFAVSTAVVGPAVSGDEKADDALPAAPADHQEHHR